MKCLNNINELFIGLKMLVHLPVGNLWLTFFFNYHTKGLYFCITIFTATFSKLFANEKLYINLEYCK